MIEAFRKHYGSADEVRVYRAPGRVNLIGEHTDYNLGFVLPVALQLATYIAAAPSGDATLRIYSEQRDEQREFRAATVPRLGPQHEWSDYVIGVARELSRLGFPIAGGNMLIRSTVPEGSGLSSSAALEVSAALALLGGREIDRIELAKLCQRAERNFIGVPVGIMDQYISVFGREHAAVEIDCRSLGHRLVNLPEGATFVAVNSMVKHELAGSAYRDRVAECAAAASALGIASLRDATIADVESKAAQMADVVARRARHIVTENDRVHRFVESSAQGDPASMGRLMVESHRSLQYDYEVSCAELNFLVDRSLAIEGVYGSRMTGGGFGGCTVALLRPDAVSRFRQEIADGYQGKFHVTPAIYDCAPSEGAGEVTKLETIPAA